MFAPIGRNDTSKLGEHLFGYVGFGFGLRNSFVWSIGLMTIAGKGNFEKNSVFVLVNNLITHDLLIKKDEEFDKNIDS